MKKAVLTVTILLVAVLSTACINNFAVQELNNKAKEYLDKGNFDAAISRLQSSLDLDSSIFETHYNLGIALTNAERYKEAIDSFHKAINLRPETKETYYSLAVAQENYARTLFLRKYDTVKNSDGTIKKVPVTKEFIISLFNDALSSYEKVISLNSSVDDMDISKKQIESIKTDISSVNDAVWIENPEQVQETPKLAN